MTILWLIVTLVAIVVEVATQALVSVWFAVGGMVTLLLAYFKVPVLFQVLAFFAVSVVSFYTIRRYLIPYTQSKFVPTNLDRLIGAEAVVTRELALRSRGEVKINGQYWTARCDDPERTVAVDSSVLIRAIEGATLIVSAIEEDLSDT